MAASQFTIYRSTDASAPTLTGTAGSLLTLLDAVLVNGYGGKTQAGWSKPFANSGNIGCYQNSTAGTGFSVSINDNGPGLSSFKECRFNGFEVLASVSTGTGQFPAVLLSQGVASAGYTIIRKSATLDSVARPWIILADAYTMYMFALTGDIAGNYPGWSFGDIFSLRGSSDAYRCFISGRTGENQGAANQDSLGTLGALGTSNVGSFLARTVGGGAYSIAVSKHGDGVKGGASLAGLLPTPNPADNTIYLSPVWVVESVGSFLRGRLRGFYQILHPTANFVDGQMFSGTGDFAGKTFMVIKTSTDGNGNIGMYVMETSATVETN